MSGSSTQVLLPARLTEQQRSQLNVFVRSASGAAEVESFWLLGQPYSLSIDDPGEEALRFNLAGWVPAQAITICCHCRGKAGDLLLAFIAARVAEMFSGLIALGSRLESHTSNPSVLTADGRYRSEELGDVLTPACMNYWAGTPEFKMTN
ncbi:DUF6368 family protein [Roseateles sp. BYS78W]|uniref:DUF6368 family protein n=1 Tax=Pelomonas candidula TaxID=3299025 RepID=A0ABW7H7R5_9BURK